ncbi:MAG: hypothetical protein KF726_22990 [Anaerolineae bacterium]|nr:hypothetical protein [Anaerolineae bacterium]
MIKRITVIITIFAFFIIVSDAHRVSSQGNPPGSYQTSCKDISVLTNINLPTLIATCLNRAGKNIASLLLHYPDCIDDISNFDGQLVCTRSSYPKGSYQRTCTAINFFGGNGRLSAVCRTRGAGGSWIYTELEEYAYCLWSISNLDGQLACVHPPTEIKVVNQGIQWVISGYGFAKDEHIQIEFHSFKVIAYWNNNLPNVHVHYYKYPVETVADQTGQLKGLKYARPEACVDTNDPKAIYADVSYAVTAYDYWYKQQISNIVWVTCYIKVG